MKAGIKTTEFWLVLGTFIMGLSKVITLPPWAYPIIVAAYELSRSIAKYGENGKANE